MNFFFEYICAFLFTEICYEGFKSKYISIGSGDGLTNQAEINDDPDYWPIYA